MIKKYLQPGQNQPLAMVFIILACFFWVSGYIYSNQHNFSPILTTQIRGIFLVIFGYMVGRFTNTNLDFKSPHNFKWLNIRNLIAMANGISYAFSQYFIPLPVAATINATNVLSVFVFDYLMYGITVNRIQKISIIVAFFGVILVTNGPYIIILFDPSFTNQNSKFQNYLTDNPLIMVAIGILHFTVMVFHGLSIVLTKKLKNVHTFEINYHQGVILLVASAAIYPFMGQQKMEAVSSDIWSYIWAFALVGLPLFFGQTFYLAAFTLSNNHGLISSLAFSSIVIGYFYSIFRYGQRVNFVCLIGSLLIVGGIVNAIYRKQKKNSEE